MIDNRRVAEQQYLDILREIHEQGIWDQTRQVDKQSGKLLKAKTIFGRQMTFLPDDGVPLTTLRPLTTAFYYFIGEVFWIMGGGHNLESLHKYGVKYWDDWADEEHCGYYGYPVGEFGRTYGPQWRSFRIGANLKTTLADLASGADPHESVDQIATLFNGIRERWTDRRLIVTAWHPGDVQRLVVRPCHGNFHVRVLDEVLHLLLTQWSADFPVGVPSNMVMYDFIKRWICMYTGLKEGPFIYHVHDTHYYENQTAGVEELLSREPRPYPNVTIHPALVRVLDMFIRGEMDPLATREVNPDGLPYHEWLKQHIKLEGYNPHPAISRDLLPVAI